MPMYWLTIGDWEFTWTPGVRGWERTQKPIIAEPQPPDYREAERQFRDMRLDELIRRPF